MAKNTNTNKAPPAACSAATTTFTTTLIPVAFSHGESFTISYPPPNTWPPQYITILALTQPDPEAPFAPAALPALVLTNVVGAAVDANIVLFATTTLSPTPRSSFTATNSIVSGSGSTSAVACSGSSGSTCWGVRKQALVGTGIGVGALLIIAILLWWCCFRSPRSRVRRIRVAAGRHPSPAADLELGKRATKTITIRSRMGGRPDSGGGGRLSPERPWAGRSHDAIRAVAADPPAHVPEVTAYKISKRSGKISRSEGASLGVRDNADGARRPDGLESTNSVGMSIRPKNNPDASAQPTSDRRAAVGAAANAGLGRATMGTAAMSKNGSRGGSRPAPMREKGWWATEERVGFDGETRKHMTAAGFRRARDEDEVDWEEREEAGRGSGFGNSRARRRGDEEDFQDRRPRRSYDPRGEAANEARRRGLDAEEFQDRRRRRSYDPRDETASKARRRGIVEEDFLDRRPRRSYDPRDEDTAEARRRGVVEQDFQDRRPRRIYDPRDEDVIEARRDRNPRRARSPRRDESPRRESFDREQRRPRSVSPSLPAAKSSKDRERERKKSQYSGWAKWLSLIPLIFEIVEVYAEPDGGWEQYIPKEKRKGKGKMKKLADEQFDKHHKKIPESLHRSDRSPRSVSSDRAYDSKHRRNSPVDERDRFRSRSARPSHLHESAISRGGGGSHSSRSSSPLHR